jgi:hypothetical protein
VPNRRELQAADAASAAEEEDADSAACENGADADSGSETEDDDALSAQLRGVRFTLRCSLDVRPRCDAPGCPCGGAPAPTAGPWCAEALSWRDLLDTCALDERISPAHATLQLAGGGGGEPVPLLPALRGEVPLPGVPGLRAAAAAGVPLGERHTKVLHVLQLQAALLRGDFKGALALHNAGGVATRRAQAWLTDDWAACLLGTRLLHASAADVSACAAVAAAGGLAFGRRLTEDVVSMDLVCLGCLLIGALAPVLRDAAAEQAAANPLASVMMSLHGSAPSLACSTASVESAARALRAACEAALGLITHAPAGASRHDVAAALEAREHHTAAASLLVVGCETGGGDGKPGVFVHLVNTLPELASLFSRSTTAAAAAAAGQPPPDARLLAAACRAAGRLFRAITAQPRTAPGLCAEEGDDEDSSKYRTMEWAICCVLGTLGVLRGALAAGDAHTARWVLTYALLPAAFFQLHTRRAQIAGFRRGLQPGPDIAQLPVRCAFCLCRRCAPRRGDGFAEAVMGLVFGASGLDVVCAALAANAAAVRAPAAAAARRGARALPSLPRPPPPAPPPAPVPPPPREHKEEEEEEDDDDALCVCCLDAERDTALPGCADVHAPVLCAPCAVAVCARAAPTCPLCRAPVAGADA